MLLRVCAQHIWFERFATSADAPDVKEFLPPDCNDCSRSCATRPELTRQPESGGEGGIPTGCLEGNVDLSLDLTGTRWASRDLMGGNFLAHQRNVVLAGGTGTGRVTWPLPSPARAFVTGQRPVPQCCRSGQQA